MFLGQYRHSLDAKGRLAIPARFREHLPTGSVVTLAPDGALRVYPPAEWTAVTESLRLSAANEPTARALTRRLFAEAHEIEYDGQGRVLIPARLREAAGITNQAVVAGANNVVEIWNEGNWQALQAETNDFTELVNRAASPQAQNQ
jgi:MraZ protein